jgi:hypothetical protein
MYVAATAEGWKKKLCADEKDCSAPGFLLVSAPLVFITGKERNVTHPTQRH